MRRKLTIKREVLRDLKTRLGSVRGGVITDTDTVGCGTGGGGTIYSFGPECFTHPVLCTTEVTTGSDGFSCGGDTHD